MRYKISKIGKLLTLENQMHIFFCLNISKKNIYIHGMHKSLQSNGYCLKALKIPLSNLNLVQYYSHICFSCKICFYNNKITSKLFLNIISNKLRIVPYFLLYILNFVLRIIAK